MIQIYIAGPYSRGDSLRNVRNAISVANRLEAMHDGIVCFVPHLFAHWDFLHPHDYEYWMRKCLHHVRQSDAVLRIPGESPGAERECDHAKLHGIPVFRREESLKRWLMEPQNLGR